MKRGYHKILSKFEGMPNYLILIYLVLYICMCVCVFALAKTSSKTSSLKTEKEMWILTLIFEMCCEEVK
jgi:MFS-type transporter involved in bile tolerance (Atg22 family)